MKGMIDTFTFHYVSTYTYPYANTALLYANLHSTMFLLIRRDVLLHRGKRAHLHSTMFLLIPYSLASAQLV